MKVHPERDPLLGISPDEIPPHVLDVTIDDIVKEAHRLIGDVLAEPIGFYARGTHARRRRTAGEPAVPAVHETLLQRAIDDNEVVEFDLIPEPQRAFDPPDVIAQAVLVVPVRAPDGRAIAAAYLAKPHRHPWSIDDLTLLRSATRIAEADARLRIAAVLIEEREHATRVLAEFGAELAAIRRLDEFGPAVGRAVQRLAGPDATAVVELHDRRVRMISNAGLSAQEIELLEGVDIGEEGPTARCLVTAEPAYYSTRADLLEVFPRIGRYVANGIFHAWGFVPIESDGEALGAIVANWQLAIDIREMRRSELEEIGRIAGLALRRLRVQETARVLAGIEAALSGSPTVDTVIDVVTEEVRHLLGANSIHLGLIEGTSLRRMSSSGLTDEDSDYESVELPQESRVRAPVREGKAIFLTPGDTWSDFPALSAARDALGAEAMLSQPIIDEGQVIGILTAAYLDERDCGPYERKRAELVSVMLARAIHRASLFDRERKITHELQRSLLPEGLPERPGYTIAARYLAADAGLDVGGDWFDAFGLRRGGLAIALGDIVGHGLQAAGAAGQLRSACRALADVSDGPTDLVARLDEFCIHAKATQFATLLYGELDESSGRLEFCRAGHIPPILVDAAGAATVMEADGSWLIGLDAGAPRATGTLTIEPGARLLVFTDGLIERRGEDLDAGYQRLLDVIEQHWALPAEDFADALIDDLAGDGGADDRCLLVVERH
jgi:serine phosphatase RsbU (regulator of sigma subunit)